MHIDWWTLALQTVNVLVLIWILSRFFFRPVADLVAKRKAAADERLAEADAARQEAADARAEAARLRASIDAERDRLVAEARQSAEAVKADLLAQSARDLQQRRQEAESEIQQQRHEAQQALIAHASTLSVDIARRLLARLPGNVAFSAFLAGLGAELKRQASDQGSDLLAGVDSDHPLEVVTATALTDTEADQLRQAIYQALGAAPVLRLSVDPNLIAGFELRGRTRVVRNNWQADLTQILRELERD
jgi:F-type H+-transporting ATPase subunit b